MLVNDQVFGRGEFLPLVNLQPNTWLQRGHQGAAALAYGQAKPFFPNTYSWMDVIAVALTNLINVRAGIDLAKSAGLVRDLWEEWTAGIAATERAMDVTAWSEQIHFVVAVGVTDRQKVIAAVGKLQEAINKIEKDADAESVPVVLPLQIVVRAVQSRGKTVGKTVGITPPTFFTPAKPGTAAFKEWIDSIREHRRFAETKAKGKAKKAKVTA